MFKTYKFITVRFLLLNGDCGFFFVCVNDAAVVENIGYQDNKSLDKMYTSPGKIKATAFVCIKFH